MLFLLFLTCIKAFPDVTLSFGTLSPPQKDPEENLPAIVYQSKSLNKYFDYDQFPLLSCCPTNLTKYKVDTHNTNGHGKQKFTLPLTIVNNEDKTIILR